MTKIDLPDKVGRVALDAERLSVLQSLHVLDTPPDADFDRIARMAAAFSGTAFGQVTLIDAHREWCKANHGCIDGSEIALTSSFCVHSISQDEATPLCVLDATQDPRFRDNPLVTEAPGIRFYAGAPIIVRGQPIGAVCIMDPQPRDQVEPDMLAQLQDFADTAGSLFQLKDEARVRARTSADLMREEWRHAFTLEAGKVGSWVWDIGASEIACNDMFGRIFGLTEGGLIDAERVAETVSVADRKMLWGQFIKSLKTGVDFEAEFQVQATGNWVSTRGRVYQRDASGRATVMMGVSIDITESRRNAEHTRLLLRELNHRVKNTLAMIQSVARQTLRQNPDPREFIEAFSGRLRAISDTHLLLADRDWTGAQLDEVLSAELGNHFRHAAPRLIVRGQDVALPPDHALGLGLILHELATNAHRFGAWSRDNGRVELLWELEATPQRGLRFQWVEHGGPATAEPTEPGLGVKLIRRGLAKVLDSNVDLKFGADGVKAEIWLPLPSSVFS